MSHDMTRTLFIYGSLAPDAARQKLSTPTASFDVLEVETLLPPSQRPTPAGWINSAELLTQEDLVHIDDRANSLLELYLEDSPIPANVPVHRAFRAACLGMTCRKWMVPYLVNLELARRVFDRRTYDRIIVSPGAGISFRAWTQIAGHYEIPVEFLTQEQRPWSLNRRWQRLKNRWKQSRPSISNVAKSISADQPVEVLCASTRLSRLLSNASNSADLDWRFLSEETSDSPDPQEISRLRAAYSEWWEKKESLLLASLDPDLPDPRSILSDLGRQQSQDTYPRFAWKYQRARERLSAMRPRLLLCDTQEGSDERAWSLAASELGIPVAAYTYDHIPQPKFSFRPDHLLCDSGRNALIATRRGHEPERIVHVASHRKPPAEKERPAQPKKIILYADSYYSGTSATVEPQRSYKLYQLVVETARRLPDFSFHLKFHPLRDRKKEDQCFIGMDEDELHVRTGFIKALNPPSNVQIIAPEENMLEHLQKASVLLNSNSTAGLEGFVLGVPVIFLYRPPNTDLGFPLIFEHDACLVADDPDSLVGELTKLLHDPAYTARQISNQRRYVDDFYWSSGRQPLVQGIQSILTAQAADQTASAGTSDGGPKA